VRLGKYCRKSEYLFARLQVFLEIADLNQLLLHSFFLCRNFFQVLLQQFPLLSNFVSLSLSFVSQEFCLPSRRNHFSHVLGEYGNLEYFAVGITQRCVNSQQMVPSTLLLGRRHELKRFTSKSASIVIALLFLFRLGIPRHRVEPFLEPYTKTLD